MPRPRLDDMVKRKPASAGKVRKVTRLPESEPLPVRPLRLEPPVAIPTEPAKKVTKHSRYMLWSVAAVSVAILLLAFSFLLGSAKAEVHPKIEEMTINETFTASSLPGASLPFEVIAIEGEKSREIKATEKQTVSNRATGTAIIFNAYSSAPQPLAIDTRLSGSNGKIYKTRAKTTIPGMKPDGKPGSVEVAIYAAEPGEAYNSGPLDFQIVGFKGTPKYEKFRVRSKPGTEISGGYVGETLVASEAEKQAVRAELETALREELFKKAADQIPDGFVMFPGGTAFAVTGTDFPLGGEELSLTLRGSLEGLMFDKKILSQKIAEKKAGSQKAGSVFVPKVEHLELALQAPAGVSFEDLETVSFRLTGPIQMVYRVDEEAFLADILGRPKKDFTSLLSKYENIDRVELTLSPVWKRSVPEEAEKVEVRVMYPEAD